MVSLVALIIWHIPLPLVILGFLTFGALDGVYLSSALTKVPDGAWFTLILAVLLSSIFVLWRFGKENQWRAEASDHLKLCSIIATKIDDEHTEQRGTSSGICFTAAFGGASISAINGMGIFFDKSGLRNTTPAVFIHFVQKFQAAPRIIVFFHIRPLSSPTVPLDERFTVTRCWGCTTSCPDHQFFRVTLRHGYTDEVISQDLGLQIYEQLRNFVIREGVINEQITVSSGATNLKRKESSGNTMPASTERPSNYEDQIEASKSTDEGIQSTSKLEVVTAHQEHIRQGLSTLEAAYHDQIVYVVGKGQMRIREVTGCKPRSWYRRITLAAFLWLRSNTGSKIANLNVDVDKLVEIGFVKII